MFYTAILFILPGFSPGRYGFSLFTGFTIPDRSKTCQEFGSFIIYYLLFFYNKLSLQGFFIISYLIKINSIAQI